jgi:hypothetical protein
MSTQTIIYILLLAPIINPLMRSLNVAMGGKPPKQHNWGIIAFRIANRFIK